MASKALLLLGLFALLFFVSEVAAASERQSGTVKIGTEKTVQPDQYNGGNGGRGGNGGGGYNGRGHYNGGGAYNGGGHGGNGGAGYNGGGRGCRHGCCYRGHRGCSRCCSYAGEAVQTQPGH